MPNRAHNPDYKPSPSLKPVQGTPKMTDADAALAAPLRKKLERLQVRTNRIKNQLSTQKDEATPALSDYSTLQETQEQLEIYRKEYDRVSEALYD